jgi:hypothetical protein
MAGQVWSFEPADLIGRHHLGSLFPDQAIGESAQTSLWGTRAQKMIRLAGFQDHRAEFVRNATSPAPIQLAKST